MVSMRQPSNLRQIACGCRLDDQAIREHSYFQTGEEPINDAEATRPTCNKIRCPSTLNLSTREFYETATPLKGGEKW